MRRGSKHQCDGLRLHHSHLINQHECSSTPPFSSSSFRNLILLPSPFILSFPPPFFHFCHGVRQRYLHSHYHHTQKIGHRTLNPELSRAPFSPSVVKRHIVSSPALGHTKSLTYPTGHVLKISLRVLTSKQSSGESPVE
ncbi:hypothetical protein QQF64_005383 [Cirrhinus molitorella]|uniref:Uncharacterized protein n=1 Tax=Cirrhinus molitorella TaxID=172907 RepID=A0ABR3MF78_9TELE